VDWWTDRRSGRVSLLAFKQSVMKTVISLRIAAQCEVNVVTMFHSSLLNGNVLTEHSSAAGRRAAECGYLNSQQLTERERAHWTFFRS
jgi:hypothetical protein